MVSGVGNHRAEVAKLTAGTELASLTSFVEAIRSEAELREIAKSAGDTVGVPFDQVIDLKRNEVVVMVAADDKARVVAPSQEAVRIEYVAALSKPAAQTYGGLGLSGGCTTAFSVYHPGSNKYGILTAAHCSNTQSYQGTNLPIQGASFQVTTDAQWHTTPGFTDAPKFKTSDAHTRLVTGVDDSNDISVGMTMCKFGVVTKGDCGELININFRPGWVPNAEADFGQIKNCSVDMSTEGDSGGPVYHAGRAVGIISGWYHDPFCSTDYNIFSFLYFDNNALNVQVLVSS